MASRASGASADHADALISNNTTPTKSADSFVGTKKCPQQNVQKYATTRVYQTFEHRQWQDQLHPVLV